jgi:hypothetical protein
VSKLAGRVQAACDLAVLIDLQLDRDLSVETAEALPETLVMLEAELSAILADLRGRVSERATEQAQTA